MLPYARRRESDGTFSIVDVVTHQVVDRAKTKSAAIQKVASRNSRALRQMSLQRRADLARASKQAKQGRLFDFVPNPAVCGGRKPVELLTDRAKRYRANRPDCRPRGRKKCVLCGSRRNVVLMHLDGDENNLDRRNLAWGCKSCNTRLGLLYKRLKIGRPTQQFNPSKVPTFGQYAWAVAHHVRGATDEGGAVIHATPRAKRLEYARRISELKSKRGTHRQSEVPF